MPEPTDDRVSEETRKIESEEAAMQGHADRAPTPEEERLAEENKLDPNVAESYEEAAERGANAKGEGRVE